MVVYYPDIASFQSGLSLSGASACVAKSTEGTGYTDPFYAGWRDEASREGIPFSAYHYLHAGNTAAQAAYAHSVAGSTPLMLDVELNSGNLSDVIGFRDAYRALGGNLWGVYLPFWYWQQIGSPSLTGLGCALVSSSYTTYSSGGPGWLQYGGVFPTVWQYTDRQSFNGQSVDFNAYRGTVDELRALWSGSAPTPTPVPTPVAEEDDFMAQIDPGVGKQYAFGVPSGKKAITFACDGGGQHTNLRLAIWDATGVIVSKVDVTARNPQRIAFVTSTVYLVSVTREDAGTFPISVTLS
jgi:hypothetical protein